MHQSHLSLFLLTLMLKAALLFSAGQVLSLISFFVFAFCKCTVVPHPSPPVTSFVYLSFSLSLHTCSAPLSLFFASLIPGPLGPRACQFYDSWAYFS